MRALLQYLDDDLGIYKHVGIVRPRSDQDFTITPVTQSDRIGDEVLLGYRVRITATALELNGDFLALTERTFRLTYFKELQFIALGLRNYSVEFDGASERNEIVFHRVRLDFQIAIPDYNDYTTPLNLPPSEGGIIIQDDDIYLES